MVAVRHLHYVHYPILQSQTCAKIIFLKVDKSFVLILFKSYRNYDKCF